MSLVLRPYEPGDRDAVYDVCVRTGEAGGDARGVYDSDDLLPDLFAGPYLHLEPELAIVLDDGHRAVGYVLGTADTPRFVRAYRQVWLPRLADRYPPLTGPPRTPTERLVALHHAPERMLVPELAAFPAHLHVDLLPSVQGGGYGRALLEQFLHRVQGAGAPSVHLGMVSSNTRARGFYDRLGFVEVPVADAGATTYLVRSTAL